MVIVAAIIVTVFLRIRSHNSRDIIDQDLSGVQNVEITIPDYYIGDEFRRDSVSDF